MISIAAKISYFVKEPSSKWVECEGSVTFDCKADRKVAEVDQVIWLHNSIFGKIEFINIFFFLRGIDSDPEGKPLPINEDHELLRGKFTNTSWVKIVNKVHGP